MPNMLGSWVRHDRKGFYLGWRAGLWGLWERGEEGSEMNVGAGVAGELVRAL